MYVLYVEASVGRKCRELKAMDIAIDMLDGDSLAAKVTCEQRLQWSDGAERVTQVWLTSRQ